MVGYKHSKISNLLKTRHLGTHNTRTRGVKIGYRCSRLSTVLCFPLSMGIAYILHYHYVWSKMDIDVHNYQLSYIISISCPIFSIGSRITYILCCHSITPCVDAATITLQHRCQNYTQHYPYVKDMNKKSSRFTIEIRYSFSITTSLPLHMEWHQKYFTTQGNY